MHHFIERHRQRVLITEHHHAERIANQQNIHARFIEKQRGVIVVGCEAGNFLLGFEMACEGTRLAGKYVRHGHFTVARTRCNTHRYLRCRSRKSGCSPLPSLMLAEAARFPQNYCAGGRETDVCKLVSARRTEKRTRGRVVQASGFKLHASRFTLDAAGTGTGGCCSTPRHPTGLPCTASLSARNKTTYIIWR